MIAPVSGRLRPLAALCAAAVVLGAAAGLAWTSDDAFITFRSLANLLAGEGLVWNPGERVQAFTNTLWLLMLAPPVLLTRDPAGTAIVVGLLLTAGFLAAVWRLGRGTLRGFLLVAVLALASKAFIDYATSGLENALSHALLAALALAWAERADDAAPRTGWIALICGLAMLNRFDLALMVGPLLLLHLDRVRRGNGLRQALPAMALGFAPLLLWLAGATVYFGSPFPNTFYAKIFPGADGERIFWQGVGYLANVASWDPVTPATIVAALAVAAFRRTSLSIGLAAGIVLHLFYVVRIGGDFMAGRFLTVPFAAALLILAGAGKGGWPRRLVPAVAAASVVLAAFFPRLPLAALVLGEGDRTIYDVEHAPSHITDERLFYFHATRWLRAAEPISGDFFLRQFATTAHGLRPVTLHMGAVGMAGFGAGPDVRIIDLYGLGDPFLARILPAGRFAPGHNGRRLPRGYLKEILCGGNGERLPERFHDTYRSVRRTIAGPLWDTGRLAGVPAYAAGTALAPPGPGEWDAEDQVRLRFHTTLDAAADRAPGLRRIPFTGLMLHACAGPIRAGWLVLDPVPPDPLRFRFLRDGQVVATIRPAAAETPLPGAELSFDAVLVEPADPDAVANFHPPGPDATRDGQRRLFEPFGYVSAGRVRFR